MKKTWVLCALLISLLPSLCAQESDFHANIEVTGSYISSDHVPFWFRSNQFGSIPPDNESMSFTGNVRKDYTVNNHRIFDWGASFEGRANFGNKTNFLLIEGYGKIRIGIFELKAGRSKEITGLCDTSLSSGAFAVSGNALGIPKIQIGIPEFYSLPLFGKLFAFKGTFAHGWVGETPVNMLNGSTVPLKTYLHQKTFYGRFGKPGWKWKLYGGFNHQANWGSEREYYGSYYTLSDIECYWYIVSGKAYGTSNIPSSKIGNHLGSIDLGFEYNFPSARLFAYHQFFYDIGALYHLANLRDGLNGISLTNRNINKNRVFGWKKILLEFLYSKNQAGELWSPETPSGDENYYNSDQYPDGWSYKGIGIGNPLLSTASSTRAGLPSDPRDFFINNRVIAFHLGFEGSVQKWNFIMKTSYSLNYGTFGTSVVGHTLGKIRTLPLYGIFSETKQLSSWLAADRELKNHFKIGFSGAFDSGGLLYDSFGLQLRLSKSF